LNRIAKQTRFIDHAPNIKEEVKEIKNAATMFTILQQSHQKQLITVEESHNVVQEMM